MKFAAIFIEHKSEGIIKISFRSKGNFDVNDFARKNFNGGGHVNAAGGRSDLNLSETIDKFLQLTQDNSTLVKRMKGLHYFMVIIFVLTSCKSPEARRPISQTTSSFISKSVSKNKNLIKI